MFLLFVLLYKYGDAIAGAMANPFYFQIGFSGVEIAGVTKVFGVAATLVGVFAGGALVARVTGDVAGFVLAISSPAPSQGYLCALMVDPSHQGQGVGAQLLVGAEDFLRGSGTQQVCVAPEDSPAMFWLGVNMATSA